MPAMVNWQNYVPPGTVGTQTPGAPGLIDTSGWQWGEGNKWAFDPTSKKYYQGMGGEDYRPEEIEANPALREQQRTFNWGTSLKDGELQWLYPQGYNYGDTLGADAFTGLDKLTPEQRNNFGLNNLKVFASDVAPEGKRIVVAPEETLWQQLNGGANAPTWARIVGATPLGMFTRAFGGVMAGAGGAEGGLGSTGFDLGGLENYNGTTDLTGGGNVNFDPGIGGGGGGGNPLQYGDPGYTDTGGGGLNLGDTGAFDSGQFNPSDMGLGGNGGGYDLSQLGGPTNLQDLITKMDGSGLGNLGNLSTIGKLLAAAFGYMGSSKQADSYKKLADQYSGYGAPYRNLLAQYTSDPASYFNSPAAQEIFNQVSRKFSPGGNPAGDPFKQAQIMGALAGNYGQERQLLGGLGGLNAFNSAAPQLGAQAIGQQGNMYNAIGYGLNAATGGGVQQLAGSAMQDLKEAIAKLSKVTSLN